MCVCVCVCVFVHVYIYIHTHTRIYAMCMQGLVLPVMHLLRLRGVLELWPGWGLPTSILGELYKPTLRTTEYWALWELCVQTLQVSFSTVFWDGVRAATEIF